MKPETPQGPYLLAIETATAYGSVAVFSRNQLLGSLELRLQQRHAQLLMPMVEQLLNDLELRPTDLAAIGVSRGPGSYTGLRVGVSTAKGLCYALGLPLLSYSSLEALAQGQQELAQRLEATVIPMIDARRMEVYCAHYDAQGQVLTDIQAKVIEADAFAQELSQGPVVFCGDGAEKCRAILETSSRAIVLGQALPRAAHAGDLLWGRWEQQAFEDLTTFEPFYLKDFRATQPKDPLRHVRGEG